MTDRYCDADGPDWRPRGYVGPDLRLVLAVRHARLAFADSVVDFSIVVDQFAEPL